MDGRDDLGAERAVGLDAAGRPHAEHVEGRLALVRLPEQGAIAIVARKVRQQAELPVEFRIGSEGTVHRPPQRPAILLVECKGLGAVELLVPAEVDVPKQPVQPIGRRVAERAPGQRLLGYRAHVARQELPLAERLHERDPVVPRVGRKRIDVGGDQRAQIFAEGDVDRRAIVERADAHGEHLRGRLGGLVGEARRPVRDAARRPAGRRCRRWRAGSGPRCAAR